MYDKSTGSGTQIKDEDILKVLKELVKSRPVQDKHIANPPGRQHVIGSTVDMNGTTEAHHNSYSGMISPSSGKVVRK